MLLASPTRVASIASDRHRRLRPDPLDERAGPDQIDAVAAPRTRRAAARSGYSRSAAAATDEALDRDIALVVVQRGQEPAHRGQRVGHERHPTCPSARRGRACVPRRRSRPGRAGEVVSAGAPMSQLPESAITITSAAKQSLCSASSAVERRRADLLLALDEHRDPDGQVVAERADRREVGGDPGLVVGGAAAEQASVALGRLERFASPSRRGRRSAGRRGARRAGRSARRSAPACARSRTAGRRARSTSCTSKPSAAKQRRGRRRGPAYVVVAVRIGADRGDPDQIVEIAADGREGSRRLARAVRQIVIPTTVSAVRPAGAAASGRSARPRLAPARLHVASAKVSRPRARASQVNGSVSTTAGGVPRVCRAPSMHWTAA